MHGASIIVDNGRREKPNGERWHTLNSHPIEAERCRL
jgi:hypothetical protein